MVDLQVFLSCSIFAVTQCGNSSVGRAQPCQGWGREFESRFPLHHRIPGLFDQKGLFFSPVDPSLMSTVDHLRDLLFSTDPTQQELGLLLDQTQNGGRLTQALEQQYRPLLRSEHCSLPELLRMQSINLQHISDVTLVDLRGLIHLERFYGYAFFDQLIAHDLPKLQMIYCDGADLQELVLYNLPELEALYCYNNRLTELELYNLPKLTQINCTYNQLTQLTLRGLPRLTQLKCGNNALSTLSLNDMPALTQIYCPYNKLQVLDLSQAPKIVSLACANNVLKQLVLPQPTLLKHLYCSHNQLDHLPTKALPYLTKLHCDHNQITEIDVRPLPKLRELSYLHEALPTLIGRVHHRCRTRP